jgi:hypothetical protein
MITLRNGAKCALISAINDVEAVGSVFTTEAQFLTAAPPEQVTVFSGTYTYATATTALQSALGAGWTLDPSKIPPARTMVSVPAIRAWRQPTGAQDAYPLGRWVAHKGANYYSLIAANVWEPIPTSTLWQISPVPPPAPWVQPTGAHDAYKIGDRVTKTVSGRTETLWESKIAANTTVPGGDSTFDRWWKPVSAPASAPQPWSQPMPGTARAPYLLGEQCTAGGKTWRSLHHQNVWRPTGAGAWGWAEL